MDNNEILCKIRADITHLIEQSKLDLQPEAVLFRTKFVESIQDYLNQIYDKNKDDPEKLREMTEISRLTRNVSVDAQSSNETLIKMKLDFDPEKGFHVYEVGSLDDPTTMAAYIQFDLAVPPEEMESAREEMQQKLQNLLN